MLTPLIHHERNNNDTTFISVTTTQALSLTATEQTQNNKNDFTTGSVQKINNANAILFFFFLKLFQKWVTEVKLVFFFFLLRTL